MKKKKKGKTEFEDIFDGELIHCWMDEDAVFLSFPWVTINFPKENWDEVREELKELMEVIKNG